MEVLWVHPASDSAAVGLWRNREQRVPFVYPQPPDVRKDPATGGVRRRRAAGSLNPAFYPFAWPLLAAPGGGGQLSLRLLSPDWAPSVNPRYRSDHTPPTPTPPPLRPGPPRFPLTTRQKLPTPDKTAPRLTRTHLQSAAGIKLFN